MLYGTAVKKTVNILTEVSVQRIVPIFKIYLMMRAMGCTETSYEITASRCVNSPEERTVLHYFETEA